MTTPASETPWGKRDSLKAYNVRRWGIKYFDINNSGNVTVSPLKEKGGAVEIVHVVRGAERRGRRLPLVIRFASRSRTSTSRSGDRSPSSAIKVATRASSRSR